jgi:hypothetical protein
VGILSGEVESDELWEVKISGQNYASHFQLDCNL